MWFRRFLTADQKKAVVQVKNYAMSAAAASPIMGYRSFTLHNEHHWTNMIRIAGLILQAYVAPENMSKHLGREMINGQRELFLFLCAVYLHDIGMYETLTATQLSEIDGTEEPMDLEELQRKAHNDLVLRHVDRHFDDLKTYGLVGDDLRIIKDVCRLHRDRRLNECDNGLTRKIAALLRVCDELDLGHDRAPLDFFLTNSGGWPQSVQRNWVKHIMTGKWRKGFNVGFSLNKQIVILRPVCNPPDSSMINFLLDRIMEPINREFNQSLLTQNFVDQWNIEIQVLPDRRRCQTYPWGWDIAHVLGDWQEACRQKGKIPPEKLSSNVRITHEIKVDPSNFYRASDSPFE